MWTKSCLILTEIASSSCLVFCSLLMGRRLPKLQKSFLDCLLRTDKSFTARSLCNEELNFFEWSQKTARTIKISQFSTAYILARHTHALHHKTAYAVRVFKKRDFSLPISIWGDIFFCIFLTSYMERISDCSKKCARKIFQNLRSPRMIFQRTQPVPSNAF